MARLTAPNGSVVNVTDDKATRLRQLGYAPVEEPKAEESKKAPAKRSSSKKSDN